jgi:hypothetical protein
VSDALLAGLADERRTMVFFESPHRLADALTDAAAAFGAERPAAVCRELTKTYEEIRRGPLAELAAWAADGVRGEITLVVAGAPERVAVLDAGELAAAVAAEEAAGATRKDAIRAVVVRTGLPRRRSSRASMSMPSLEVRSLAPTSSRSGRTTSTSPPSTVKGSWPPSERRVRSWSLCKRSNQRGGSAPPAANRGWWVKM